jgi:hypothetical protein
MPALTAEQHELRHLIAWARRVEWRGQPLFPTWLYRINGSPAHSPLEAVTLASTGVVLDLPQLHLPIPVPPWPGLYLTIKPRAVRLTAEQAAKAEQLRDAGALVQVVETSDDGAEAIRKYLGRSRTPVVERGVLARARGR